MTLGYRKVVIRIRKSAGLGYPCRVGDPVRGFGEPHRTPRLSDTAADPHRNPELPVLRGLGDNADGPGSAP